MTMRIRRPDYCDEAGTGAWNAHAVDVWTSNDIIIYKKKEKGIDISGGGEFF